MVRKSSSGVDNTRLFVILGILAFAIIIGTIVGSSYKEKFTNKKTLVYIYMDNCPHCKNFEPIWDKIVNKIKEDKTYSNLTTKKLDINNDEIKDVKSAPTIMILPSKKTYEDARDVNKILDWAVNS
jgi:thiol-disulfide isomerase/thioredoxin